MPRPHSRESLLKKMPFHVPRHGLVTHHSEEVIMTSETKNTSATRKAAKLRDRTERRLVLYALAAAGGTLLGAPATHAEVVFTPSSEIWTDSTGPFLIDMDNDGNADFQLGIFEAGCGSTSSCIFSWAVRAATGHSSNGVVEVGTANEPALRPGARIGAGHYFGNHGAMFAVSDFGQSGSWQNVEHRYLGVKFILNNETHYGWIGFRSVTFPGKAVFQGWAYETTPNKAIRAGDTGSNEKASIPDSGPTSLEVLASGQMGKYRARHFPADER